VSPALDLRHHGDAEVTPDLVDCAVNVRLPGPPTWLQARLAAALDTLGRYPDPVPARAAVAARHGRRPAEVLLTAGAAEAFVLIARALRPRLAVCVHPNRSHWTPRWCQRTPTWWCSATRPTRRRCCIRRT